VLVEMSGALPPGMTFRDAVNYLPLVAIEKGLLSPPGRGTENIFNSRIIEFEGLPDLAVEEAFELTCSSAERSAAAATVALSPPAVCSYLESSLAILRRLVGEGYQSAAALRRRIAAMEEWLKNPSLLTRDEKAEFSGRLELRLDEIREPVLACPNNPDRVAWLSAVAGQKIDEVFIGSCMTSLSHLRAAATILKRHGQALGVRRLWVAPATRLEVEVLEKEGALAAFRQAGARIEIPGCSLCMGNQARVEDNAAVMSTSTRNFDNRMGNGAQVYLASSQVAMVVACLGRIPTWSEYAKFVL
ncbi:MAG: aconitase family protein, partial [Planctomycetota bacterium]|nr:aconitase family protein [Planctomycetota bacterium]